MKIFLKARIKLTFWYLAIITAISLSFSVIIYLGINRELVRLENSQTQRQQRVERVNTFLRDNGLPLPPEPMPQIEIETVEQARVRILTVLGIINISILVLSGVGGYFLAGQTLDPISKMLDEQKEFVGNASHELRTPITSLKTEIEVSLRDKNITLSDAKKLLASNLDDVNKMQRLTNYLLELNSYEGGKEIPMTKVDLKNVADEAVGKLKVKKNLKSSIVVANKDALVELIRILVDNAIKYSNKRGEVSVTVAKRKIEVKDNGIGIREEDIPHIFDRFYRADTSRNKSKIDGYGLGLSIAKSVVDLHKGKIEVNSKVGKGTTFTVYL